MPKNLKYGDCLTNELLGKQSKNQFELVSIAIKVADYLVRSGKAVSEWPDNVANEVLRRMADDRVEKLDEEVFKEGE